MSRAAKCLSTYEAIREELRQYRHVHFAFSVNHGKLVTVRDRLRALGIEHRGPVRHEGGDQSLYFEDPEGNVVEAWDFFEDGDGATAGIAALA
jgi:catechol-2,3-dioxygenase